MTKNTAPKPPADLNSPTGYCSHRNHAKCPYRPGGACENGIGLSDGGFYMCPCSCHMQQKHAVNGKRVQLNVQAGAAARKEARQAEVKVAAKQFDAELKAAAPGISKLLNDLPATLATATQQASEARDEKPKKQQANAGKSVVATILADHTPAAKTASRKPAPASRKSTESALKASGKGKASTAAAVKPQATNGGLSTAEKKEVRIKMAATLRAMSSSTLYALDEREMAYVEAHWLKYIDPDLDKARRDAAAAK